MRTMMTSRILHLLPALAICTAAGAREPQPEHTGYRYRPVGKGIEVADGEGRFNRPFYSSVEDRGGVIALAGDRPEFMLMRISAPSR